MDTKRFFTALLSTSLFLATAFSQNQVMEKQYSLTEPIIKLVVTGNFSVEYEYTTGERSSITIIGAPDIVQNVKVETIASKKDAMSVVKVSSDNDKVKSKLKLIIEGEEEHLEEIELSGSTSLETKSPIEVDVLKIIAKGASSANIIGTFQTLAIETAGASSTHASGTTEQVIIDASGVSEVDISKLEYQESKINTSGVSHVSVNEKADNEVTSSGISSISSTSDSKQNIKVTISDDEITISESAEPLTESTVIIKTVEGSDSTVMTVIEKKIEIKDGDKTETITIGPYDIRIKQNQGVKWYNKRKNKFNGHWGGIELGINGYNTPDFNMDFPKEYEYMDLTFPKSTAFYLNLIEYNVAFSKDQKWGMLTGLGFEWHNYRFSKTEVWLDASGDVLQYNYIDGAPVKKSKLMVCYMTIPLIFEFQTNNKSKVNSFHVGLGVVGGLRIGSHTKAKFESSNGSYCLIPSSADPAIDYMLAEIGVPSNKKIKNHADFYLTPLKLDATARVGWSHINLFATYSLTQMFRANRGPELYPWSVGITLLGW